MRSVWFNMIFDFFSESCGYWRSRGICNHCVLARWMHSYPICCLAAQTLSHPQPGCAYNPWFGIQWQFTNIFVWEWNCYHFFLSSHNLLYRFGWPFVFVGVEILSGNSVICRGSNIRHFAYLPWSQWFLILQNSLWNSAKCQKHVSLKPRHKDTAWKGISLGEFSSP